MKPATPVHTHSVDDHSLGLPVVDTPGFTWEMRTKSLPHLGGKYLLESRVSTLDAKGKKTSLHSFSPKLSKIPIHTNYGSSQGLQVLDAGL